MSKRKTNTQHPIIDYTPASQRAADRRKFRFFQGTVHIDWHDIILRQVAPVEYCVSNTQVKLRSIFLNLGLILLLFLIIGSNHLFAANDFYWPDDSESSLYSSYVPNSDSIICPDIASLDISYFKSYGGPFGEQGNAVLQCPNGNVATGMNLVSPTGDGTVYPGLLLTDPAGTKIFCKKYPDIPHPNGTYQLLANEQGFLLGGATWLMQTDQLGEVIWFKDLTGDYHFWIQSMLIVDGGCLIVGASTLIGSSDTEIGVVMIDTDGEPIWSKRIITDNYQLYDLTILPHGTGYMLAGTGMLNNTWRGILLLNLDADLDVMWSKYFDTFYDDRMVGFHKGIDGNFYICGKNYGTDSQGDVFVLKVDETGDLIDEAHFDSGNGAEQASCSTIIDGHTLAIGYSHGAGFGSSPGVISIDCEDLSVNWSMSYQYQTQYTNYVHGITAASNGGLIMVGDMVVPGKSRDTYLIHTLANGDAGCNTFDYPMTKIEKEWTLSNQDNLMITVNAETTEMAVEALDAFAVTEFMLCENIPPCANFEFELTSSIECETYCFNFSNLSAFAPNTWEWTFDQGSPASYSGPDAPEVCWTESGEYQVQLTVSSESGVHTVSEFVYIEEDCPPIVPNVFTPNSDGVNDQLQVINLPSNFTMTIYNRWGDPLFVTVDSEHHWQGKIGPTAQDVSDGVYYYSILDLDNGQSFSGYVQVLR